MNAKTNSREATRVAGAEGIEKTYAELTNEQARAGWQIGYQEGMRDMLTALADGGTDGAIRWARANGTERTREQAESDAPRARCGHRFAGTSCIRPFSHEGRHSDTIDWQ